MASSLKLIWEITAAVAAFAASPVRASEIGPISRATVTISLSIAPRVEVQGIEEANLTEGQARALCVSANTATRGYGVSLLTSPAVTDPAWGEGSSRPIAIEWAGGSAASPIRRIAAGSTVTGFVAGPGHCTAGSAANASLIVRSLSAGATTGPGRETIATLLIVPE